MKDFHLRLLKKEPNKQRLEVKFSKNLQSELFVVQNMDYSTSLFSPLSGTSLDLTEDVFAGGYELNTATYRTFLSYADALDLFVMLSYHFSKNNEIQSIQEI